MKFNKILVPTDFSECAKEALHHAARIAAMDGGSLHLVHAVLPTDYPVYHVIKHGNFPNFEEEVRRNCTKFLEELVAELPVKVPTTFAVVEGFPGQVVAESADEQHSDLVVIGTHGHTGVKHALLGSTAEAVVRHSRVPVMTVRGDGKQTAPDAIQKILAPTDFSDAGFQAVEAARTFAERTGAELILAHVMDAPLYPDGPFGMVTMQMPQLEQEVHSALEERLVKETDRLAREGAKVKGVLRTGRAHLELVSLAAEEKVDAIVMGTRGHGGLKHLFLGSTAANVVRRATCPVLTVHRE